MPQTSLVQNYLTEKATTIYKLPKKANTQVTKLLINDI